MARASAPPLLLATANPGKLNEIRTILAGLPFELETLADHPGVTVPEETGSTFAENARLKARHYAQATGRLTVAEDSGLEIDALGGAPGVQSARFNGNTYEEKFEAIYAALGARHQPASTARFVCCVALARGPAIIYESCGVVEGRIAPSPQGHEGFGYDPIFYYPPYGRTLGEVSEAEKAAVSHRGHALRALREFLSR